MAVTLTFHQTSQLPPHHCACRACISAETLQVSYRAALGGLRREKQWEAAVKLLSDMQRRGVGPDEISTAMAMNTCVSAQQPLRALDLFRDMRDIAGVFPGLMSVTALLEALADLGQWEDALRELRALSASGVKVRFRVSDTEANQV